MDDPPVAVAPLCDGEPPVAAGESIPFVGRTREIAEVRAALAAGKSVLIVGRTGIGKTALMRYVADHSNRSSDTPCVWAPKDSTKESFRAIAKRLHELYGLALPAEVVPPEHLARAQRRGFLPWEDLRRPLWRLPMAQVHGILIDTLRRHPGTVVLLESLEVPPSQADFYKDLLDVAQVVAGMDETNYRSRIQKLLWQFNHRIDLKPLPLEASRELANHWVEALGLRFSTDAVRARFIQATAQHSGGVPEAIRSIVETAAGEDEITPAKTHEFHHEAGRQYLDMTPIVVFSLLGFVALRYFARGLGEIELNVVAGLGMTLFLAARLLMGALKARK